MAILVYNERALDKVVPRSSDDKQRWHEPPRERVDGNGQDTVFGSTIMLAPNLTPRAGRERWLSALTLLGSAIELSLS